MPPAAIKSLAAKSDKSVKDLERYYKDAKQQVKKKGKDLSSDDYRRIMGIVKKRAGLPTKPLKASAHEAVTYMIEMVSLGADTRALVESYYASAMQIRSFYDSGILHVATQEDVLIEPGTDTRVDQILSIVNENEWPHDHPLLSFLDGYEGSLDDLYGSVLYLAKVIDGA